MGDKFHPIYGTLELVPEDTARTSLTRVQQIRNAVVPLCLRHDHPVADLDVVVVENPCHIPLDVLPD